MMSNRLPFALVAASLLLAACGGPEDETDLLSEDEVGTDESAAYAAVAFAPVTGFTIPAAAGTAETRKLFKTKASFESYFHVTAPVDFAKKWVVYYSAGTQRTGGYEATITAVQASASSLKVSTKLDSPGAGCRVTQALSKPGLLVSFNKPSPAPGSTVYAKTATTRACGGTGTGTGTGATGGLPLLGNGTHAIANVDFAEISERADGLSTPRDLAFNPYKPGELWVVNRADDTTTTYSNVGTENQTSEKRRDGYAEHFMEETSAIAFGQRGTFGTCGESRNTYNDHAHANDFMGPTLWSSDMSIYAVANPEGLGSHLDMLHESPLCMGLAWDNANVYWAFDGLSGALVRYDFVHDHGPGYDDHSDGIIDRYVTGQISRVANVPSHMALDKATGRLYVADTGNRRIAVLDTRSGRRAARLQVKEAGTQHWRVDGASLTTLVSPTAGSFSRPSGLVLAGGKLYVGDNATGRISAFSLDGTLLDYLDTGLRAGALMGLDVDPQGRLYFVDATGNRLLRIAPRR